MAADMKAQIDKHNTYINSRKGQVNQNIPTQFKQGAGKPHIVSRTRCNISDESACYSVARMEANDLLQPTIN